jgi:hypothetical protein
MVVKLREPEWESNRRAVSRYMALFLGDVVSTFFDKPMEKIICPRSNCVVWIVESSKPCAVQTLAIVA